MPQDIGLYQDIVDYKEAAEMLGIAEATLRSYYRKYGLTPIQVCGRAYFTADSVRSYVQAQINKSNTPFRFAIGAPVGQGQGPRS